MEHEINLEITDGIVYSTFYIDGILIDKYPRIVPDDFYDTVKTKLAQYEIAQDIKDMIKKYC